MHIYILNTFIGVLILLTPESFYDDFNFLSDILIFAFVIINSFLFFRSRKNQTYYFLSSIFALLYCLTTTTINIELDFVLLRIEYFGIKNFSSLTIAEYYTIEKISFFSFIAFLISEFIILMLMIGRALGSLVPPAGTTPAKNK